MRRDVFFVTILLTISIYIGFARDESFILGGTLRDFSGSFNYNSLFSNDSRYIFIAGNECVRKYDVETGYMVDVIKAITYNTFCECDERLHFEDIALSNNNRYIATKDLVIIDLLDNSIYHDFAFDSLKEDCSIMFSNDDKYLFVKHENYYLDLYSWSIKQFDFINKNTLGSIFYKNDPFYRITSFIPFVRSNNLLISEGNIGFGIFDISQNTFQRFDSVRTLRRSYILGISNSDRFAIFGSHDKILYLYDLFESRIIWELAHEYKMKRIYFSKSDQDFYLMDKDSVYEFNLHSKAVNWSLKHGVKDPVSLDLSPDGKSLLIYNTNRNEVRVLNINNKKFTDFRHFIAPIIDMIVTGNNVLILDALGQLSKFDINNRKTLWRKRVVEDDQVDMDFYLLSFNFMSLSKDGLRLAITEKLQIAGKDKRAVRFVDAVTGEKSDSIDIKNAVITDIKFSNDGKKVIVTSSDSYINVWDYDSKTLLNSIKLESPILRLSEEVYDNVYYMIENTNDTSFSGQIRPYFKCYLINIENGKTEFVWQSPGMEMGNTHSCSAFSRDNKYFAINNYHDEWFDGDDGYHINLINNTTGEMIMDEKINAENTYAYHRVINFSQDSKHFLLCSDTSVISYNVENGNFEKRFGSYPFNYSYRYLGGEIKIPLNMSCLLTSDNLILTGTSDGTLIGYQFEPVGILETRNNLNNFIAYPNPSDGLIKIDFSLDVLSDVGIELYDIMGKKLKSIVRRTFSSGINEIDIEMSYPSGIYFLVFDINGLKQFFPVILN